MFGLKYDQGKFIFKTAAKAKQLDLLLYKGGKKVRQIPFDPDRRIGDVWQLEVADDISDCSYIYSADGHAYTDENGTVFYGRGKFGNQKLGTQTLKTPIKEALERSECPEEWKKDRPLNIPYHDSIIYRLHVRGFTRHRSSGIAESERGTFLGLIKKIPYLQSLGITAIELMPPYEFNEVMLTDFGGDPHEPEKKPTGRINYWGFTKDALHKAPKLAYTSDGANPLAEFRKLVFEMHRHGIEVIIDLFFTDACAPDYISNVMRYWRVQFHVDGIHLIGYAPYSVIARDPYLSRFKLWADSWDGYQTGSDKHGQPEDIRYLADYNDGFQDDMRRILKGDENMLSTLMRRIRENPSKRAVINYMANVSGMTLLDSLSYDRKHNEDNGERNMDGTDLNYSWNCGQEGPTRKRSIQKLRKKMERNAYLLLMLSQGTPLIQAGDEFGHTKKGNNNSYCEDNETNWLDWSLTEKNKDLLEFARFAINFRKKHPVFHQESELKNLDYRNTGIPDISFHGENAWQPDMENFRRQLGAMYSGAYQKDDSFIVLYNFHWEDHLFRLPHPLPGMKWKLVIDTACDACNGIITEQAAADRKTGAKPRYRGGDISMTSDVEVVNPELTEITLEPRSIVVLEAVPSEKKTDTKAKNSKKSKSKKA